MTVAVHFDQPTGTVAWGDRRLGAAEFAELIPRLPGWADAVAESGGTPKLIVVACGGSGAAPGGGAYLDEVARIRATQVLGLTPLAVQHPGGDIRAEHPRGGPVGEQPTVMLHHPDRQPATALGTDLTAVVGRLAGNVPAIAVTPDQDKLLEPYVWASGLPAASAGTSGRRGVLGRLQSAGTRLRTQTFGGYHVKVIRSGQWLRPQLPAADEQALAETLDALPSDGRELLVVGTLGPLPAHVIDQVRDLIHQ